MMKTVQIEIPSYDPNNGFVFKWEAGSVIHTTFEKGVIELSANKEGLISLANHLLNLAQEGVPLDYHFHLDESNSLEEGSCEMIIQKN